MARPSDVAFNPEAPDELWVTNRQDDSIVIVFDPSEATQTASRRYDPSSSNHFLARPSALAFGEPGTMATIHDEDDFTQGPPPFGTPADFMGPTLWDSDSVAFDGGHAVHLDMLHNTPNGQGIEWAGEGNAFWVFDGYHASITLYDFHADHGKGGTDHTDGEILRYAEGEVSYVPEVSSHLALDPDTDLLYIADTGASRIATLDTTSGTLGASYGPNYDGGTQNYMDNTSLTTFVDSTAGLVAPSGLALHDGLLWVADNDTAILWAFDLTGVAVDWLETGWGAGSLQGFTHDADGNLYVVDAASNKVLKIEAP
jgi:DNA-binding beta-propeller fold protein YncE